MCVMQPVKGIVSFYEKPGCKTNTRQKEQLKAAGYVVQSIDMLSKQWEQESLAKFFNNNSPRDFINPRAPEITSGAFDPAGCSDEELYTAMIATPILIKRPLLFFRGEFGVGFDCELATQLLGSEQEPTTCSNPTACD